MTPQTRAAVISRLASETVLEDDEGRLHDFDDIAMESLAGRTMLAAFRVHDALVMIDATGAVVRLVHHQSCCESVVLEDINGDLADLVDTPLLVSEERVQKAADPDEDESATWSFYTLRTIKGSVDLRWHGTSNGYYSETVDVEILHPDHPLSAHQRRALCRILQAP